MSSIKCFELERLSKSAGIKAHMAGMNKEEFGLVVYDLKKLGANNSANFLTELNAILMKEKAGENLNENEFEISTNAHKIFAGHAEIDQLPELILNYIQANNQAIRKELSHCQK